MRGRLTIAIGLLILATWLTGTVRAALPDPAKGGFSARQWHVNNSTVPVPLAVREVEVNNPTDKEITALVRTAKAVPGRQAVEQQVTVPAGATVYVPTK